MTPVLLRLIPTKQRTATLEPLLLITSEVTFSSFPESATDMPENTFDIVSKIDLEEVSNAIQQASKEVHTRFDLKDSKSKIELEVKTRSCCTRSTNIN